MNSKEREIEIEVEERERKDRGDGEGGWMEQMISVALIEGANDSSGAEGANRGKERERDRER